MEIYTRESGRSFEENQEFFHSTADEGRWAVRKVDGGKFTGLPGKKESGDGEEDEERESLLKCGRQVLGLELKEKIVVKTERMDELWLELYNTK